MSRFKDFHESINLEMVAAKDRVRSLLHPSKHWGEDGRHKEEILKQVLRRHLPKTTDISSGFVRLSDGCTNQMDIVLSDATMPTLFKTEGFSITTPSMVLGLVEVKTSVTSAAALSEILDKLAGNAAAVRKARAAGKISYNASNPWAALFVYEEAKLKPEAILNELDKCAKEDFYRIVQCITFGPNLFFRFWPGRNGRDPYWEGYKLNGLSYSYLVSNIIWQDIAPSIDSDPWFALREGKDPYSIGVRQLNLQRESGS